MSQPQSRTPVPENQVPLQVGAPLPTPEAFFGFAPGRDGRLAPWHALWSFLEALAAASPRVRLLPLGNSTEGRPLLAVAIAAPEVLAALDTVAADQQSLLRDPGAAPSTGGPPVTIVAQTCGVHAPEAAAPQGVPALAAALAGREDASAEAIRRRVLFLLVPSVDPDGLDRMQVWTEWCRGRAAAGLAPPGLYRRYAEHDINRDWIMQTQPEIRSVVQGIHGRFLPHVLLDMHEMWPTGPRMFLPPYAEPADPAADPEVIARAGALGSRVAAQLTADGLAGVATATVFDAYSPARAYVHYHGGVRLLCETAGAGLAAAVSLPVESLRGDGNLDPRSPSPRQPLPWPGGVWTAGDVMHYQQAATWATLAAVAADAEQWRHWQREVLARAADPAQRRRIYHLPAQASDPAAARALLEVLRLGGLRLEAAPDGGTLVRAAQPFGTWADTLLRAQPYPAPAGRAHDVTAPYDVTAHLLPALMGVPCEVLEEMPPPGGPPAAAPPRDPQLWPAADTDSYRLVLTALAAGQPVCQLAPGPGIPAGGAFAPGVPGDLPPAWRATARPLVPPQVGIYGAWKSGSDEGWLRYVLDRFGQPFRVLRDAEVQRGHWGDCTHLILPSLRGRDLARGLPPDRYPPPFAGGLGERGRRQLREFVARGGRLLAVEAAAAWAQTACGLPLEDQTLRPEAHVFAPGAILTARVQPGPLSFGAGARVALMYRGGPAFQAPPAVLAATFDGAPPLAGLAEGTAALAGAGAIVDVPYHAGRCILYAFSPYFRAQSWGTFRWLFNALLA